MQQYTSPDHDPLDSRPLPRRRRSDRHTAPADGPRITVPPQGGGDYAPAGRAAFPPEDGTGLAQDGIDARPMPRSRRGANARRTPSPAPEEIPESRPAGRKREKTRLSLPRILVLVLLVCCCALCASRFARDSLALDELKADRERIAREYQAYVDRHKPRYTAYINTYSDKYGISPAFVSAIIYRESSYVEDATSSAGARGLMQLMPDTGTWMAEKAGLKNYTADSLYDPETNIMLGTRYLNYLSGLFDGDPILVACGYHAGANNVKAWIRSYSSDGVALTLDEIPMEDTRTYARRVMESYAIYLQHYYPEDPSAAYSAAAVPDPGAV